MLSLFDEKYYLQAKLALLSKDGHTDANGKPYTEASLRQTFANAGLTPMDHYLQFGGKEGLNPNPYFNEAEYLQAKLRQVQSHDPNGGWTVEKVLQAFTGIGLTPLEHYARFGAFETDKNGNFINPSNAFDANAYWSAKLLELQTNDPEANYTLESMLAAFASVGLDPVSHYRAAGAGEANKSGIALVQTVPVSQRVPNDAMRETVGDIVPDNYNAATSAPGDTGKPVAKPADVGGLADAKISPEPDIPSKNQPVPGDKGYVEPPSTITDTAQNAIIPPTTSGTGKATDHWAVVDPADGSALFIKQDGTTAGWLPGGSVTENEAGDLVVPDVAAQTITSGSFAATTKAEAVSFSNGKIETYTVAFGDGGTHEVQSVDFTGITMLENQRLVLQSNGDTAVLNSTTQTYADDKLATLAASVTLGGWTTERDGAKLTYTATSSGDKEDIGISYSRPQTEVQTVDFNELSLAAAETIKIDGTVIYTAGAATTGAALAAAFAATLAAAPGVYPLTDWTLAYTPGETTVTFTSKTANTDERLLVMTMGAADTPLTVAETAKGGPSVPTPLTMTEVTKGTDGILADSSLSAMDVIFGFNPAEDFIATPNAVGKLVRGGELESVTEKALAAVAGTGSGKVGANEAGLFSCNGAHYLLINDDAAAFDAGKDIVIKLVGLSEADVAAMSTDIFV